MSIIEQKEHLTSIARNNNGFLSIAAIAELNKMEGAYPPTRVETQNQTVAVKRIIYRIGNTETEEMPTLPLGT